MTRNPQARSNMPAKSKTGAAALRRPEPVALLRDIPPARAAAIKAAIRQTSEIAKSLIAVIERESGLVKAMNMAQIRALQPEKARLVQLMRTEGMVVKTHQKAEVLALGGGEMLHTLKLLDKAVKENEIAVKAAIAAGERVIAIVRGVVAPETARISRYGRDGRGKDAPGTRASVAIDQRL